MVMKTPGVYIVEKNAFPNSVVQVATAVPAFIGYTEKAMNGNVSLDNTPFVITSMSDYHSYFGGAPKPVFALQDFKERDGQPYGDGADLNAKPILPQAVFTAKGPKGLEKYELVQTNPAYTLYSAIRIFYSNGGGRCYVTSIGSYDDPIDSKAMINALTLLKKEPEPTMVVIPETTRLTRQNSAAVQGAMLMHCGMEMKNRFAILDIHGGYLDERSPRGDPIACFRYDVGTTALDFGAAYYPWLDSSAYQSRDFTFANIDISTRNKFISLLKRDFAKDKEIVDEILKVGTAEVTGDFTLSLEVGGSTVVKPGDIAAQDDSAAPEDLKFKVSGDPEKMAGKLSRQGSTDPVTEFTQDEINKGLISFTHDAEGSLSGQFELTVVDDTGIETDSFGVMVVTGKSVVALQDVEKGTEIEIDVAEAGADAESVVFVDADAVDEIAVVKDDATVKAAVDTLDAAPDDASDDDRAALAQAVKDAEAAAITAVKGKTLTQPRAGVWSTAGNKLTFKPNTGLREAEVTVMYQIATGGTLSAPKEIKVLIDGIPDSEAAPKIEVETIDKTMRAVVPLYTDVMNAITKYMNTLPPAAAMAGVYTMVDNSRGVWKAPANVSVASVVGPMVNINHDQQANLNVSTTGKSINAIRPFVGEGTLVWGARTLDGNSLDWRYINVRRTMIMIEESIRLAAKAYVFEPNTANTWVTVRSMIENFLTGVWKAGGLAGSTPADAFSVHVGLGETMTPVDILEGKLLITVLVAVTRPAEFIEITFMQQMQKS